MGLLNNSFEKSSYWYGCAPKWKQYVFNVGLLISQCLNGLLLGCIDESISSRLGRCQLDPNAKKWAKKLSYIIDGIFGKDHCINACEGVQTWRAQELWSWSNKWDYPKPPKYISQFPKGHPGDDLHLYLTEEQLKEVVYISQ